MVGLTFDATGNLYGTTAYGGICGHGTVFELTPNNGKWTEKVLHNFNPNGKSGYDPSGGLILDNAGNLYGTTGLGGTDDSGVVFEWISNSGKWTEKVLHDFNARESVGGAYPSAGLVLDNAGTLYGTTVVGGTLCHVNRTCGVVFELIPNTGKWTESVLHDFNGKHGGRATLMALLLPAMARNSAAPLQPAASPHTGTPTQTGTPAPHPDSLMPHAVLPQG